LDGANRLRWPAPYADNCTARPATQPGLNGAAAGGGWRQRLTVKGQRCAQDLVDLGDQRQDVRIQVQDF
jgi:hypothetical protein